MDLPNYEGIGLLLDDSFAGAAHNLGADPDFHNLIVYGRKPEAKNVTSTRESLGTPGNFDPLEPVALAPKSLSKTEIGAGTLDSVRRVAVLVSAGEGHGSGFFITDDGHILTNAHVVGDAGLVRVVSSNGAYKMVAEVLRRDRVRDVALLRVQKLPENFSPALRPIRLDIPRVGEEAYAIGTPLQEKNLQDTVTKGIISAWRPRHRNDRQSYIQADITIQPGNSGGPLLDAHGNITGIAVSGVLEDVGGMAGLNYFVPIVEALEVLDIKTPPVAHR
jgi:S1-C subfamily serine protease